MNATHDDMKPGRILYYPYMWKWQRERGEDEARKRRPSCLVAVSPRNGQHMLFIMPITSTEPPDYRPRLEIPAIEVRGAGLLQGVRQWLVTEELNVDILETSDLLGDAGRNIGGRFSLAFTDRIFAEVQALRSARALKVSQRMADQPQAPHRSQPGPYSRFYGN